MQHGSTDILTGLFFKKSFTTTIIILCHFHTVSWLLLIPRSVFCITIQLNRLSYLSHLTAHPSELSSSCPLTSEYPANVIFNTLANVSRFQQFNFHASHYFSFWFCPFKFHSSLLSLKRTTFITWQHIYKFFHWSSLSRLQLLCILTQYHMMINNEEILSNYQNTQLAHCTSFSSISFRLIYFWSNWWPFGGYENPHAVCSGLVW